MEAASSTEELHLVAEKAGLDAFGICSVEPFVEVERAIRRRVEDGMSGGLKFTFAEPEISTDVGRSFPWVRRLAVGGRAYVPEAGLPAGEEGRVARFAVEDFYVPLRRALGTVADWLRDRGWHAEVLADDNRLVDRAAAVRAGLGWWGKNTMVLVPQFGPWMLFGSVATDAVLPVDAPMRRDCGTCDACLPACPTGALVSPGVLDATRCLSYWAQTPGIIPADLRAAMEDRFYGCDDCIEACPPGGRILSRSTDERGDVDPAWVLSASGPQLLDAFSHFYIPRRDPDHLRRNALVVMGNRASAEDVPWLLGFLEHRSPVLRAHTAWALGRIGDVVAREALVRRKEVEASPRVLAEIDSALGERPA